MYPKAYDVIKLILTSSMFTISNVQKFSKLKLIKNLLRATANVCSDSVILFIIFKWWFYGWHEY